MRGERQADTGGQARSPSVRDDDGRTGGPHLRHRPLAATIALLIVAIDQLTKWWALNALDPDPMPVIGEWFQFKLVFNTGASFSMFQNGGQVIGVVAAAVVVLTWYFVSQLEHRMDVAGVAIVMGGAAGNLVDRVVRGDGFLDGAVVDFLDFSFFPTFNVADVAINVGVGLLLIGAFIRDR